MSLQLKETDKNTKYLKEYAPQEEKPTGWWKIILGLMFFFPVGMYLLYQRMGEYRNSEEMLRRGKTSRNWGIGFSIIGVVEAYASTEIDFASANPDDAGMNIFLTIYLYVVFGGMIVYGLALLYKNYKYKKIYEYLPDSIKYGEVPLKNVSVFTEQTASQREDKVTADSEAKKHTQSGGTNNAHINVSQKQTANDPNHHIVIQDGVIQMGEWTPELQKQWDEGWKQWDEAWSKVGAMGATGATIQIKNGAATQKVKKEEKPYYIIVTCKGCNATNKIQRGTVGKCEYCGGYVGEDGEDD